MPARRAVDLHTFSYPPLPHCLTGSAEARAEAPDHATANPAVRWPGGQGGRIPGTLENLERCGSRR
ncbi:hypothetical protein [Nocardia asiatica]|uniref:hypothetical protein n=1 Tax=Nocardia asiatica TaxID=209252 RepID=UPI003EE1ED5E